MEITTGLDSLPRPGAGRAAAIGSFDGVHIGHQQIMKELVASARSFGLESAVVTFEPHPLAVLMTGEAPPLLTDLPEKARLVGELGADRLVVVPFDRAFAAQSPEEFVRKVLIEKLRAAVVMEGYNFTFGHRGLGTTRLLVDLGRQLGIRVRIFDPVILGGETVSSTLVRTKLSKGRVEEAAALLGRPYSLAGEVVPGDRRGRKLGCPTANVAAPGGRAIPGRGVYAVWGTVQGETYPGMANIGIRPTFGPGRTQIEVHLLDFGRDIYGQRLSVDFVKKLRDEMAFPGPQALLEQLGRDREATRSALGV